MPETYKETILRYRIIRHDELPEAHKAEMRIKGIDPDDNWSLIYSFADKAAAEECLASCERGKASWQTYRLRDAGQTEVVERAVWF